MIKPATRLAQLLIISIVLVSCGDKPDSTSSNLFSGKCESNQVWLSDFQQSITVPADWQTVYELLDHRPVDNYWGITGFVGFTLEEFAQWQAFTARIRKAVLEGNYGEAIQWYEKLYPLMEKMDLKCGVAVTGEGALSTTIIP